MNRRVVVLGGVAWNEMVYLDRFPEPRPQTVFASRSHQTIGSSGAGKALNFRRLGWDVVLWAAVGDDPDGDRIRSRLSGEEVVFMEHIDPAGTTHHVNLMEDAGDRISIFARSGTPDLPVDHARVLADCRVDQADAVMVSIFDHCRGFLPLLSQAGAHTWIDIHDYDGVNPYHAPFIEAADHLVMSTVALPTWRSFAESRIEAGSELVACTHGAGGASVLTGEGWVEAEAVPTAVVDTNGAGDAFTAALVDAVAAGSSPGQALHAATRWAARAVRSAELAPEP